MLLGASAQSGAATTGKYFASGCGKPNFTSKHWQIRDVTARGFMMLTS